MSRGVHDEIPVNQDVACEEFFLPSQRHVKNAEGMGMEIAPHIIGGREKRERKRGKGWQRRQRRRRRRKSIGEA